jgi:hypothetical protein
MVGLTLLHIMILSYTLDSIKISSLLLRFSNIEFIPRFNQISSLHLRKIVSISN